MNIPLTKLMSFELKVVAFCFLHQLILKVKQSSSTICMYKCHTEHRENMFNHILIIKSAYAIRVCLSIVQTNFLVSDAMCVKTIYPKNYIIIDSPKYNNETRITHILYFLLYSCNNTLLGNIFNMMHLS